MHPIRIDRLSPERHAELDHAYRTAKDGRLRIRALMVLLAAERRMVAAAIAAGMSTDVTFETVDGSVNDRIDDAYRAKYEGSPYLAPMIGARARSATVEVVPREGKTS